MDDIVERIRNRPSGMCYENESCYLLDIAADEIERLRQENARLRAAVPEGTPDNGLNKENPDDDETGKGVREG